MDIGSLTRMQFLKSAAGVGVSSTVPSADLPYGLLRPIAALAERKAAVEREGQEQKSIEEIERDNADVSVRLTELLEDPMNADKLQEFAGGKYFMLELGEEDNGIREYAVLEYRPGEHQSLVLRRNKLERLSERTRSDFPGLYRYLERRAPVTDLFDIHDVGEMGLKMGEKGGTVDQIKVYNDERIRHRLHLNGTGEMQVGNSSRTRVDLDPSLFGARLGKDVGNEEGIFRLASEHYQRLCAAFIDALQ